MAVGDFNIFIQRFINEFTAAAIPCFFAISGFLFFLALNDYRTIFEKLRKRVRTLLVPFLLWNILFIFLWCLLYGLVPALRSQLICSYGITFSLDWFAKRLTVEPIVGQFWYIRTLIVFCLFTPLILWSYRSKIISLIMLALLMRNWQCVDCSLFSTEGMFCFYFGGMIGYNNWHRDWHCVKCSWLLLPVIAGMIINDIMDYGFYGSWFLRIFLTMIFLFQCSLYLAEKIPAGDKIAGMNQYSFFIYALHGSLLAALSLSLSRFFPHTPAISLMQYFFCVFVVIIAAIGLSVVIQKLLPHFYKILTGGR